MAEGEPLGQALVRLGIAFVDRAADMLTAREVALDTRVHEARKAMRRTRALLRLVRDDIGVEAYRRENASLRDAARSLAGARDAAVLIPLLDELQEHFGGQLAPDAFAAIRSQLLGRAERARSEVDADAASSVLATLADTRRRIEEWPRLRRSGSSIITEPRQEFAVVAPGILRTHRRGRAGMNDAYGAGSPTAFHEWRKRVKLLRYQVEMLRLAHDYDDGALGAQMHRLAAGLGSEHDLTVLEQTVVSAKLGHKPDRHLLRLLVADRRRHLHQELRDPANGVYGPRSKKFVSRLESDWVAWRREAPVA